MTSIPDFNEGDVVAVALDTHQVYVYASRRASREQP
jgi:hypothetical protein